MNCSQYYFFAFCSLYSLRNFSLSRYLSLYCTFLYKDFSAITNKNGIHYIENSSTKIQQEASIMRDQ